MNELLVPTPTEWAQIALDNFDEFLVDHAACERKAAAMGVSFVVQYPDRPQLIEPMIRFAREELLHYEQVCRLVVQRGLTLTEDEKDPYVRAIHKHIRTTRDGRLLDRLLAASVIEARGHERLNILSEAFPEEETELRQLYRQLAHAESRHKDFFEDIARLFFPSDEIENRLKEFVEFEAQAMQSVPLRGRVH